MKILFLMLFCILTGLSVLASEYPFIQYPNPGNWQGMQIVSPVNQSLMWLSYSGFGYLEFNQTTADARYWNEDGDSGLSGNYEGNYTMNTTKDMFMNSSLVNDCYYLSNGSEQNKTNINDLRACNTPNGVYSIQRFENINASLQNWTEIGSFGAASMNVSDIFLNKEGPEIKYYTSEFNPFINQKQAFTRTMLLGGPKYAQFQLGQSISGVNIVAEKFFFEGIRAMYLDVFSFKYVYFNESYENYANYTNITLQPFTNYTFQYVIDFDLAHQASFINVTQDSVDNISYYVEYRTHDTNEILSKSSTLNDFYNGNNVEFIELFEGLSSVTGVPDVLEEDFKVKVTLILNDTLNISGLNFTHDDGGQNFSFFWRYGTFEVDVENMTTEEWVKRGGYTISDDIVIDANQNVTGNFTGNQIRGGFYTKNNAVITPVPAVDTYVNITQGAICRKLNGVSCSNGVLTPLIPGSYQAIGSLSGQDGNLKEFHLTVGINGTDQDWCHIPRVVGAGIDVGSWSVNCEIDVGIYDDVTLMIENVDDGSDFLANDYNFRIYRVGDYGS